MKAAHPNPGRSRPALILPACHEEETIGPVLDELLAKLDPCEGWIVAVGVNGSPVGVDRTAELSRRHPLAPVVAETSARGYGYGCQAAIDRVESLGLAPDAYVFFAADGANDPADLGKLLAARRAGFDFVLGCRTSPWRAENLAVMGWSHVLANRLLGAWCGWLTGRRFHDIGPLRLIERELFHRMRMREWTFGWTVEAQITAARLGRRCWKSPCANAPGSRGSRRCPRSTGGGRFSSAGRSRWRVGARGGGRSHRTPCQIEPHKRKHSLPNGPSNRLT